MSELKAFDKSPLGAFIASPLLARGPAAPQASVSFSASTTMYVEANADHSDVDSAPVVYDAEY